MRASTEPETELNEVIRKGRAVLVAGTGVSIAASGHPQASWAGLLENGIAWLQEHKLMEDGVAEAQLTLLKTRPQTHRFISAAADVTPGMGGADSPHFAQWLKDTVGAIEAKDRAVLDALHALRQHGQGNLLATTNYDGLLLGDPPTLDPVTWKDSTFLGTIRDWDRDKVIFLHGHWRRPESVILDWKSYEKIARDDSYRENLAAFWKTNTWVYVGCGTSGLSDPDFGLLLERYGEHARQARHWDYCLVKGDEERQEFQAHFDSLDLNIRAVSYGEKHSDLSGFLLSLLPVPLPPPPTPQPVVPQADSDSIPTAPALYAEPDYIGSHRFVGRQAELDALSDWANPSDPTNLLLFEAIGGSGKSMLTWEWTTQHATKVRSDWAGRFWYSFYERGAIMEDFCQRALAYMTGRPLGDFKKRKTAQIKDELVAQLHAAPWLLILDGLERVLVAYHRIDAASIPDEEANSPTDKVLNRHPCNTIRDEDGDLLRALVAAAPSKILVSSRLTPRVLLNPAGQPIPGAQRLPLSGLRPSDAEKLLRSGDISGDSAAIRDYLRKNCDNHPLVIGILAGLINQPGPNRGDFDAWSTDPSGGAALDLAKLDLIQRRNHILRAAITALPDASRQLLSTLALLSESVDYKTLEAFNPHLPPEPEKVGEPRTLEERFSWNKMSAGEKAEVRKEYENSLKAWRESAGVRAALAALTRTVSDLEQRGLLQHDAQENHHDLHPVVRGVAAGGMKAEEKERHGQRVVDHFSAQSHNPYEQAQCIEDLNSGLHVVRTLLKLGHFQQAADAYRGDLARALLFNLEAHADVLSLLRPFFPAGWGEVPMEMSPLAATDLANEAAIALDNSGEYHEALVSFGASLQVDLERKNWNGLGCILLNVVVNLRNQNLNAKSHSVAALALELTTIAGLNEILFMNRLWVYAMQSRLGQWQAAKETWRHLDPMGRGWLRAAYRQGRAEEYFAQAQFWLGTLKEEHLTAATTLAAQDNNRITLRSVHRLRGSWRLEQRNWAQAAASFQKAVRMARERGLVDEESETGLALAKFHLGQLTEDDTRSEAERLARMRQPAHRILALLWLGLGDNDQARHHALAAYHWAWGQGEPYVHRYELTKTTELFQQMKVPIPNLPHYDPDKDEPFSWEADIRAAIEKLRAEKEARDKTAD